MLIKAVGFYATSPNVGAAVTYFSQCSSQTEELAEGTKAHLLTMSGKFHDDGGRVYVVSPHLHDVGDGLNFEFNLDDPTLASNLSQMQELASKDLLTIKMDGSNSAGEVETAVMNILYEKVGKTDAVLINNPILAERMASNVRGKQLFNMKHTITSASGGTDWSGSVPLNDISKQMRPNSKYAFLGASNRSKSGVVQPHGVRVTASEFGNVGIFIPTARQFAPFSKNFFPILSKETGYDLIPVVSGSNAGAINIEVVADENDGTFEFTTYWVELG